MQRVGRVEMIRLPKDAEGREIPLDTSELFLDDGTKVSVKGFEYKYRSSDSFGAWFVKPSEYLNLNTSDVHLDPPDSWEKLLEDLGRGANAEYYQSCYYAHSNDLTCDKCQFYADSNGVCTRNVFDDVASRIKKLRSKS